MEPGFEFFKGYKVPTGTDIDVYRKYIEDAAARSTTPSSSGLHSNADLVFRTAQTTDVLSTILDIQPKEGAAAAASRARTSCCASVAGARGQAAARLQGRGGQGGDQGARRDEAAQHLPAAGDRPAAEGHRRRAQDLSNLKLAIAGTIVMSVRPVERASTRSSLARAAAMWVKVSQLDMPTMGVWFGNILQRAPSSSPLGSRAAGPTSSG